LRISLGVGVEFVEDGGLRAMYQARKPVGQPTELTLVDLSTSRTIRSAPKHPL
jgi:hypothetical protein